MTRRPNCTRTWTDELRRRLAQLDSGDVSTLSWDEGKGRAWEPVERD